MSDVPWALHFLNVSLQSRNSVLVCTTNFRNLILIRRLTSGLSSVRKRERILAFETLFQNKLVFQDVDLKNLFSRIHTILPGSYTATVC